MDQRAVELLRFFQRCAPELETYLGEQITDQLCWRLRAWLSARMRAELDWAAGLLRPDVEVVPEEGRLVIGAIALTPDGQAIINRADALLREN